MPNRALNARTQSARAVNSSPEAFSRPRDESTEGAAPTVTVDRLAHMALRRARYRHHDSRLVPTGSYAHCRNPGMAQRLERTTTLTVQPFETSLASSA